jgi:membrane-associated HD superfamily phosphohydrolase
MSKPSKIIRATVAVFLFAITFVLLYFALAPKKYSLEVGQTAVEDIVAQSTIADNVQTETLRQQAEESVDTVYDVIPGASLRVSESVGIIMDIIDNASEDDVLSDIQKEIKNNVDITLETSTIEHILAMSQNDRNEMKDKMLAILSEVYQDEVYPDKLDEMKDYTYQYIDNTWMSQISKIEARNILGKVMVANVEENEEKTLAVLQKGKSSHKKNMICLKATDCLKATKHKICSYMAVSFSL